MEPENNIQRPFRFSDQRQQRIYRRLLLVGPGAAAFYRDACRHMVAEPPFDATTHIVAHLLREIESSLRDVLETFMDRSERLDEKKTKSNKTTHETEIRAILKGLDIADTDPVAEAWLRLPSSKGGFGLDARAHRDDLALPRPIDDEYRRFWGEMEAILDSVLNKFESRYLESHRLLDELLGRTAPTRADAQRLRLHAPNNLVSFSYFFNNLNSPEWLEPLRAENLFRHPLEPERDLDKGTIRYPPWPQSRYLMRMAASGTREVQQLILEVMLEIETENVSIHEDIAEAACAMPSEMAAQLAAREAAWVQQQTLVFGLLPEKLGNLISYIARGHQEDVALNLTNALLTVLPNHRTAERLAENNALVFLPDPLTRIELWEYGRILKNCLPALTAAVDIRALALLSDLLEKAIDLSHRPEEQEGTEDHSEIWRPGIEHEQHRDLKDLLVSAVRDTAEQIVTTDYNKLPALINELEARRWLVFKRIALHLLRLFPNHVVELIAERLMRKDNFEERELWHEYISLAHDHFTQLTNEQQNELLGWIDNGLDIESVKTNRELLFGERLTDEEAEQTVKQWKLRHLEPLRDVLPDEWRVRYQQLEMEFGRPEHAEYATPPSQVYWGFGSPQSSEDLRSQSVEQIVSFLANWQRPAEDLVRQSPEGLGRALAPAVTSEPERFAAAAESFRGLDPTYVRAFISGLHAAVKQGNVFPWLPVLHLCQWVLSQPRELLGRTAGYHDQDQDWIGTRAEISQLLSEGFKEGDAEIPFGLREPAWDVLRPLTDDPQPTPDEETRYGGTNMDPITFSLNTVRGEAMHALVRYALWIRRHIERSDDAQECINRGFEEMPEVREVLDLHLEPEREPSLAIRAVYGEKLPWLAALDQHWTEESLVRIFPKDENLRDLRSAVWETYLIFHDPYDNIFELLRDEYAYAVRAHR